MPGTGIRLRGKPLGRPKASLQADSQKQAQADAAIRNQGKARFNRRNSDRNHLPRHESGAVAPASVFCLFARV
ncbi:MAG TPA: hypothetical protein IGS53_19990 [Leptolyngbyaceae cyanobacterium M33_DOE_097]|uniref:Uncharacterized protein n=1 Tax=Oscillatoriales cyanobacterium SpSt-418 TaxID=2282169 RepID=A0A7C3KD73_9CYAN|nr:hypothetical protein [Leptolyngbyaceae cyanobacterium M33_DOE_097]